MDDELYQELIIAHSKAPKNYGKIEGSCLSAHLHNPLCGDEIEMYVEFSGDRVRECRFQGNGCAISKAVASILSERVRGLDKKEIAELISSYQGLLSLGNEEAAAEKILGDLVAFRGVRAYPSRVRCATLAIEALSQILARG